MHAERLVNCHQTLIIYILYNALRSKGTLLPLPALYFLGPPMKSRGLGNRLSSLNCHLGSSMTTLLPLALPPPLGDGECDTFRPGEPPPLADRV